MAVSKVDNAIVVLEQMPSGPLFSVLLDPPVKTISTNYSLVLAVVTGTTRKRRRKKNKWRDRRRSSQPNLSMEQFWRGGLLEGFCMFVDFLKN